MSPLKRKLLENYKILLKHFGSQHWWPGDTDWEIMVGAVLTQNTAWSNVSRAIDNLKSARCLRFDKFIKIPSKKLQKYIRPAGYFRQKAGYLMNLANHFKKNYKGNLRKLFLKDVNAARTELLSVKGIGPETADSILLYAGNKPVFVIDAYTKRITKCWGIKTGGSYNDLQAVFQKNLPADAKLYNEYHALLVALGKHFCKPTPQCSSCPLKGKS